MNFEELHKAVFEVRELICNDWPTPGVDDSIMYALTELGEAYDALLRAKRPNDKRRNDRENEIFSELGDCAVMLLTALGPEFCHFSLSKMAVDIKGYSLAAIALQIASCLPGNARRFVQMDVLLAIGQIERFMGFEDFVTSVFDSLAVRAEQFVDDPDKKAELLQVCREAANGLLSTGI